MGDTPLLLLHGEHDSILGMQRRHVLEDGQVGDLLGIFAVDRIDAKQREVDLGFLGWSDDATNDLPAAQTESADLAQLATAACSNQSLKE